MRLSTRVGFAAAFALVGCLEDDGYEETRMDGDLGRGTFVYGCYNASDTSCDDGNTALPRALAVGSRFDVRLSIASGPQPSVISPVTEVVRRVDGAFQVEGAGEFVLLAVNSNREVIDFKHLRSERVDEIRVQRGRDLPSATLQVDPRQSVELLALPFGAGGVKLGGALDYDWSSSDEQLLRVESLPGLNRVRVRAGNRPGRVLLRVAVAGVTHEVSVRVGAESDEVDASEEEQDAGSQDAGRDAAETDARSDTGAGDHADAGSDSDAQETDGGDA
jgi:hypothetical protein